ncbi:unnamed protein product [marine sediment metagenome]|uniref:Uncharacterized protein n=1 Tax=marine sediment metagenome TaxID=412755 RepID=X1KUG2_9ZZZZ
MNDEVRESKSIKMRPSVVKKARIEAVTSNKTLGEWLEEAIEEKVKREVEQLK